MSLIHYEKFDFLVCEQHRCRPACVLFRLINTFVIHSVERIIAKLAPYKLSIFYLFLVEQIGLNLTLLQKAIEYTKPQIEVFLLLVLLHEDHVVVVSTCLAVQ